MALGALTGIFALFLAFLTGCGDAGEGRADPAPAVVASIFPVAELARRIGGPDVRVRVLLPRGATPATFEPTPRTVRDLRGARVVLFLGAGLDPWARELVADAPETRPVSLLDGLELRGEGRGEQTGNPHIWLDPIRTRDELLPRIAEALGVAAPAARDRFRVRARALEDTLTALDREIRAALRPLERRAFVASHPAWVYFAERYGLRQVGVVHEHPGQEPSPRDLAGLVDEARRAGVPVVFSEPQVADAAARALALELGVPVLPLDPLGGPQLAGRDSYNGLMRYNTAQFVRGLGGEASLPRAGVAPGRRASTRAMGPGRTASTGEVATLP